MKRKKKHEKFAYVMHFIKSSRGRSYPLKKSKDQPYGRRCDSFRFPGRVRLLTPYRSLTSCGRRP